MPADETKILHENSANRTQGQTKVRKRDTWEKPVEFLLNVIGYTIGLGNVWRFCHLCYKNGGGAFLIPYLLFQALCGIPMLFMEISLGQFTRHSSVGSWDIVPILKGVGFSGMLLSCYYLSYVLVIMAWAIFYLGHSFGSSPLPWSSCDNFWNTNSCHPTPNLHASPSNESTATVNASSSTKEFWDHYLLQKTTGIHDFGSFSNWRMILCFLSAWIMCYCCVVKGIRTSGKVAYVTVLTPYVIIFALLIRGATLDGAEEGVKYFITPRLEKLADPQVWLDAAGQVFFTLGVCYSVLYSLGSYNKVNENCYKQSFICVGTCCITSLTIGLALFCYLGHMSVTQGKNISEVATAGPGLVFQVFPVGLSLLPLPQLWSALLFFTLLFVAIDTAFGTIEGITGVLEDIRPKWFVRPGQQWCRLGACALPFLLGLLMLFDGGIYLFELVNWYGSSGITVFFVAFLESAGLAWIYGVDKYFDQMNTMIGNRPSTFFKLSYTIIIPVTTVALFVAACWSYKPLSLGDYEYPSWAMAIGWIMLLSVALPIPTVAAKTLVEGEGTIYNRWKYATTSRVGIKPICSDI